MQLLTQICQASFLKKRMPEEEKKKEHVHLSPFLMISLGLQARTSFYFLKNSNSFHACDMHEPDQ